VPNGKGVIKRASRPLAARVPGCHLAITHALASSRMGVATPDDGDLADDLSALSNSCGPDNGGSKRFNPAGKAGVPASGQRIGMSGRAAR